VLSKAIELGIRGIRSLGNSKTHPGPGPAVLR